MTSRVINFQVLKVLDLTYIMLLNAVHTFHKEGGTIL